MSYQQSDQPTGMASAAAGMATLIAAHDWSATELGARTGWPPQLAVTVELLLASPLPMVLMWGPQHRLIYNDAYAPMCGARHPAALGGPTEVIWPEVWDWNRAVLAACARGETQVYRDEQFLLERNAVPEDVWLDLFYTPIRGAGGAGAVEGVLCTVIETTIRTVTQERLRIAQQAGGIGSFEWFPQSGKLVLSEEYRRLCGLPPGIEIDGDELAAMVDPRDQLETGQSRRSDKDNPLGYNEFRLTRADTGEVRWMARRGEVVRKNPRAQERYVGVMFDITERKRAEEAQQEAGRALRASEDRLRELNETLEQRVSFEITERSKAEDALRQVQKMDAIGQLTGGVAHDFNNVLQIISSNLQLLQANVAHSPAAAKRLHTAIAAVERGARLSSHLLAFARRQPLQPVVINLGHLLANMDELLRRALGEAIGVQTIVTQDLWHTQVDPGQLENVILNLAINARDAMEGVGTLTIEIDNVFLDAPHVSSDLEVPAGPYVLLAVSDTGSGMAPEVAARAFEPFFTTKAEGEGTGLGLSMAYGFVKQSHGHIGIYSDVGKGTSVRIYLPRSFEEANALMPVERGPLVGGSETVLVVEDDPAVMASVIDMLGTLGYQILSAPNAHDALAILHSTVEVDLLFTDVVMPGPLRSPELVRQAQELRPDLAVLFTSGFTQDAIVHGGRLDPGLELLSKPYRIEELGRKIRHLLDQKDRALSPAAPAAPEPEAGGPQKILVVEDNLDAQYLVCEMIEVLGHRTVAVTTAEEAQKILAAERFDVLFTDVNLPGMSGVDLARAAHAAYPKLRIVFASGYGGVGEHLDFETASLPKPYDLDQLESALLPKPK